MKFLAKDLKEWWADPDWPEDQAIDDDAYKVNGEEVEGGEFDVTKLDDADEVEVVCGSIVRTNGPDKDLKRAISAWLKRRDSVSFVVTVPKAKEAEARAAVKPFLC